MSGSEHKIYRSLSVTSVLGRLTTVHSRGTRSVRARGLFELKWDGFRTIDEADKWSRFLHWCKSEHLFKPPSSIMPLEGWNARWSQRFRNVGSTEVDYPPSTYHNLLLILYGPSFWCRDSTDRALDPFSGS